jgi:hypothetical protein
MSTFLAKRVADARTLGPPAMVDHIVLPGAKRAVPHDRLLAYQASGHDEQSIVARVNERYAADNAGRLQAHREWVAGPYHGAIVAMRELAARKAAEELRLRSTFEQMLTEWTAGHEGENGG